MLKRALIALAAVLLIVGGVTYVAHAATTTQADCVDSPGVDVTCTVVIPYPAASTVTATATATATATVTATVTASASATPTASQTPTVTPTPTPTPSPTQPTQSPPSGACATSTANVPDGSDGRGGCFPGLSNTGPNAAASTMATYTGSCAIIVANTVIDSRVVNCRTLDVRASGLMLRNSYLNGGIVQTTGAASFTVQDSLIDSSVSYPACSNGSCPAGKYACGSTSNATTDCGVTGSNFTILRTEIVGSNRAAYCERTCLIQDSYFHQTNLWPDKSNLAHASSVREEQGLTLRHSSLHCSYAGPFVNGDIGCSADLTGYPDFAPIKNNTVTGNLFVANPDGNAFCMYGGGTQGKPASSDPTNATNQVFTDNVFMRGKYKSGATGRCGDFGPVTDFITGRTGNQWTNNRWDTGELVPAA